MEDNAWEGPLQEFRHEELRSNTCIRLVQIHAGLFRGDISCTLQQYETNTQNCPDYTALSYVWGDPTPTHTIYINGLVYRVHRNLWEFLSHSRTADDTESPWFWTDLLCIDQAHHSEKNEQISRMGDIYAQATLVISWLGNHEQTVEALRVLVETSKGIDAGFTPKYAWKSPESARIHKACDQLAFEVPYWERVWIMQEVACARHCVVTCGDVSINFMDLPCKMEAAMKRSVRFDEVADRNRRIKRIKTLADLSSRIQKRKEMKFLELIGKTWFCKATRPHDRIYGLLGLASRLDPGFDPRALEVSQHKSQLDVWWDIVFMISDKGSNFKSELEALRNMLNTWPPPRKDWEPEMVSSTRRAHAEIASQVSEAAYSLTTQALFGSLLDDRAEFNTNRARRTLEKAWDRVTTHVYDHEQDVPGLQTPLGWSAYAGLKFTSWYESIFKHRIALGPVAPLPLGWVCAAHLTDFPSKTTSKLSIMHVPPCSIQVERKCHLYPARCSKTKDSVVPCDFSLVLLKIEQLGITCLVRPAAPTWVSPCNKAYEEIQTNSYYDKVQIDFYCDCCEPQLPDFCFKPKKIVKKS